MIRYSEDIVIYKNFISNKNCKSIIKLLNYKVKNNTMSWMPISFYESYSSNLPKDYDYDLKKFKLSETFFSDTEKRIIDGIASVHSLNTDSIFKIGYHTQKWEPGAYARPHSDNTDMNGNYGAFERSRYAGFLYLNDNFDGGLLKFTKQNIEIKPEIGLFVAFHGGFRNIHEVTMITKGTRYTIGSFWDDRDECDYPENLKEQWKNEMAQVRKQQEIEKKQWQDLLKDGYKLSSDGKKYKIGDLV